VPFRQLRAGIIVKELTFGDAGWFRHFPDEHPCDLG
jgi:hypothetical protein